MGNAFLYILSYSSININELVIAALLLKTFSLVQKSICPSFQYGFILN